MTHKNMLYLLGAAAIGWFLADTLSTLPVFSTVASMASTSHSTGQ